jgi:hypothetical protein
MRQAAVLVGLGLVFAASVWGADADSGSLIPAVWKEQHLSFYYMGRTSRYSCNGLRDKVRAMLLELGARRDLTITALGCEDSAARVRQASPGPNLTMVFSSPVLADSTAKPLHAGDLSSVDAAFEAFSITSDAFRNMEIADCELVEEFARQVLPKLTTRNLKQQITCVPFQQSGGRFLVRGEVLRSVPAR